MNSRQILRAHYSRLAKKAAAWMALGALISTSFVAGPANAANQLTTRSTTLSTSASSATGVTYTFGFTLNASQTLGSVKVEICDSPLSTTSCANAGNSAGASFSSATFGSMSLGSGWSLGTCSGNSCIVTHTAATLSGAAVLVINGVANPTSGANKQFYTRISTYSDTAATTPAYPGTDFGATAVSTAAQITVSANVQESLVFCVGTSGTGCGGGGLTGTTVSLGTGADNVLSSTAPSGGTSLMAADTNATTGYTITYITTSPGGTGGVACPGSLSSSNDCITDAGGTAGTFVAGTAKFGINLRNNATPDIGADLTGSGSGAVSAPYNTVDNYAFQGGTTPRTVATAAGPTLSNLYTVAYAAQAGNTTKPGAYSAVFTYVCTGIF